MSTEHSLFARAPARHSAHIGSRECLGAGVLANKETEAQRVLTAPSLVCLTTVRNGWKYSGEAKSPLVLSSFRPAQGPLVPRQRRGWGEPLRSQTPWTGSHHGQELLSPRDNDSTVG